ncbi:MAG TPA: tyrosine-type recombinase/integrase [Microvirga sp.]|nr:tyrosine-type recombinase/integrase [Microvirga sp.]
MAARKESIRLTKRFIDGAKPQSSRYELWDLDLKGFGLRVEPSGIKSFIARYRAGKGGRSAPKRFVLIGRYGALTPDEARKNAREVLAAAARGGDPAGERAIHRAAPTLAELASAFMNEHVRKKRKARTVENYQHVVDRYLIPELGRRKVQDISPSDLARLHARLADRPAMANRLIAVASSMFSWGPTYGLVPRNFNPAAGLEKYQENRRERFLSTAELERLGAALRLAETGGLPWKIDEKNASKHLPKGNHRTVLSPHAVAGVRLLLFTGCRLREILHLRWKEVDFERGMLHLPDSKTGKKSIILNAPALTILGTLPRAGEFVVAGEAPDKPRSDLKKPWEAIRRAAGLDGMRIHDLRHSFASIGAGGGLGLPIVGKLLGHRSTATTARYAHLDADPLRQASEQIAERIERALDGAANLSTM